jgi:methylphosphotriester-DNA--protein-cysteine methyltransferase
MNRRSVLGVAAVLLAALVFAGSRSEPFHGNTRSRVFHQSSCRHYTCPRCTAVFKTAEEAVRNGYRPCRICRPGQARETSVAVDAAYVGNTRSRKFHKGSCHYAGCANCTAKFESRDDAIAAGYVPAKCCKP